MNDGSSSSAVEEVRPCQSTYSTNNLAIYFSKLLSKSNNIYGLIIIITVSLLCWLYQSYHPSRININMVIYHNITVLPTVHYHQHLLDGAKQNKLLYIENHTEKEIKKIDNKYRSEENKKKNLNKNILKWFISTTGKTNQVGNMLVTTSYASTLPVNNKIMKNDNILDRLTTIKTRITTTTSNKEKGKEINNKVGTTVIPSTVRIIGNTVTERSNNKIYSSVITQQKTTNKFGDENYDDKNNKENNKNNKNKKMIIKKRQSMNWWDVEDSTQQTPWMKKMIGQKSIKKSRRNIFFVESSCGTKSLRGEHSSEEGLVLNGRQCCAIESTARLNPKYKIYIFHTCKLNEAFYELSSNHVRALLDNYKNVYLVKVQMDRLFNGTPLNELWVNGAFENSQYPLEHISDAMRLLLLWTYGGTYLDLDVISMRPLTSLKSNFAGVQDDETIANGVLNFEPSGFAHNLLTNCVDNFRDWFDGNDWSNNGPILLTNSLLEFCQVSEVVQLMKSGCSGFHLYPPNVFYPVHFSDWESFLDESETQRIMRQIENSTLVHMWNRLSRDGYVPHGSNQAFSILADKYCPNVYREVGPSFKK